MLLGKTELRKTRSRCSRSSDKRILYFNNLEGLPYMLNIQQSQSGESFQEQKEYCTENKKYAIVN